MWGLLRGYPPGPEGLALDLACPKCAYNLRGLTKPRCPECGFHFEWSDVPRLVHEAEHKPSRLEMLIHAAGWMLGLIILIPIVAYMLPVVLVLVVLMGLAAIQAVFELMLARLFADEIRDVHFRRWWEGVMISYAAAAITCVVLGLDVLSALERGWSQLKLEMWIFVALIVIELVALQYAVISAREKRWGYPVRPVRALISVTVAKIAMVAIIGTLIQQW